LAGSGYRGIGIPDCIRSGELAVKKILEHKEAQRF
jgi:protoporphyrinogen oxidase